MSDESTTEAKEDTAGHMPVKRGLDAEAPEHTDEEGHRRLSDAEADESDDVEGHVYVETPDSHRGERMR
jgi:hypothetical protein